jgi:hypothetical protein
MVITAEIVMLSLLTVMPRVRRGLKGHPVILRCALLRASKDDGPSVADSSFEARYARTSG